MEVTYNIQGKTTGAVMVRGKLTLRLIKERTKCIDIDVGGNKEDRYRPVKIKADDMKTVASVKKIAKRLVKAHEDEGEARYQTLLIKYDDGWGAMMPDNPEEALKVERSRAFRQGGGTRGKSWSLSGRHGGADTRERGTWHMCARGERESQRPRGCQDQGTATHACGQHLRGEALHDEGRDASNTWDVQWKTHHARGEQVACLGTRL